MVSYTTNKRKKKVNIKIRRYCYLCFVGKVKFKIFHHHAKLWRNYLTMCCKWKGIIVYIFRSMIWQYLTKTFKMCIFYHLANLQGIFLKEIIVSKTVIGVFILVMLTILRFLKQFKCPKRGVSIYKLLFIHTVEECKGI